MSHIDEEITYAIYCWFLFKKSQKNVHSWTILLDCIDEIADVRNFGIIHWEINLSWHEINLFDVYSIFYVGLRYSSGCFINSSITPSAGIDLMRFNKERRH